MILKLDSNNALLFKISKFLQNKLQLVQNDVARLIVQKRKHESIQQTRKDLHWLPIEFQIQYKINLLTFKCLNNLAPIYLKELLHPYEPKRVLRSADKGYLKEKKTRTVAGDRAFCNAAPVLWNKLSEDVRNKDTLESIKSTLKAYTCQLHVYVCHHVIFLSGVVVILLYCLYIYIECTIMLYYN